VEQRKAAWLFQSRLEANKLFLRHFTDKVTAGSQRVKCFADRHSKNV